MSNHLEEIAFDLVKHNSVKISQDDQHTHNAKKNNNPNNDNHNVDEVNHTSNGDNYNNDIKNNSESSDDVDAVISEMIDALPPSVLEDNEQLIDKCIEQNDFQQLKQILSNLNILTHQNGFLDQFNHREMVGHLTNTKHDEAIIICIFKTICMKPNDDKYRYAVLVFVKYIKISHSVFIYQILNLQKQNTI